MACASPGAKVKGISPAGLLPRTERQLAERLTGYSSSRELVGADYTHPRRDVKKPGVLIIGVRENRHVIQNAELPKARAFRCPSCREESRRRLRKAAACLSNAVWLPPCRGVVPPGRRWSVRRGPVRPLV